MSTTNDEWNKITCIVKEPCVLHLRGETVMLEPLFCPAVVLDDCDELRQAIEKGWLEIDKLP